MDILIPEFTALIVASAIGFGLVVTAFVTTALLMRLLKVVISALDIDI